MPDAWGNYIALPGGGSAGLLPPYVAPSTGGALTGTTNPNGNQTGTAVGEFYVNTASDQLWIFQGTVGANTGWQQYI
jgi:hypothetical protein